MTLFARGASLFALSKKPRGIRPIAVGSAFRRVAAKVACSSVQQDLLAYFSPNQVGLATKLSCEGVIQSIRTYCFYSREQR